jgi:hypothetical protein
MKACHRDKGNFFEDGVDHGDKLEGMASASQNTVLLPSDIAVTEQQAIGQARSTAVRDVSVRKS